MVSFENKSLYELRDYAREIGVRAPTTMRKKDLIIAINDVLSKKVKPYYSKRGRPILPKNSVMVDDFVMVEKIKKIDKALLDFRKQLIKIITE
ncbi:MAG: hypothetical protein E7340_06370 [Clostridiales bacterium]|nr:hypothetical protein [Clostridiales bacterium]